RAIARDIVVALLAQRVQAGADIDRVVASAAEDALVGDAGVAVIARRQQVIGGGDAADVDAKLADAVRTICDNDSIVPTGRGRVAENGIASDAAGVGQRNESSGSE